METNKLYSLAAKNGVTVDRFDMSENRSASVMMDEKLFIAVDNSLCGKTEKVCLAHELGHCVTGSFYNIYSPLDVRGKHERRANLWAIEKLIPKTSYYKAVKSGLDNLYVLSEYFDVTPDFMEKAVEHYKKSAS